LKANAARFADILVYGYGFAALHLVRLLGRRRIVNKKFKRVDGTRHDAIVAASAALIDM
jgi:hypothetical protein